MPSASTRSSRRRRARWRARVAGRPGATARPLRPTRLQSNTYESCRWPSFRDTLITSEGSRRIHYPGPSEPASSFYNQAGKLVALTHVTVIDGTGAPPRADRTLLLQAGRIAAELPTDSTQPPADAKWSN